MSGTGNRVAVVTGGTGALGQAVVSRFLDDGFRVHVPWILEEEADRLGESLGDRASAVVFTRADVTDPDAVEALFDQVGQAGGLDVLVNGVGGFAWGPLGETQPSTWERMLRLNATSCFLCSRAAVPRFRASGGRIVNVGAVPALRGTGSAMSAYAASKAAVLSLTSSLAEELKDSGVTVNAIIPSIIDTPANRASMPDADPERWVRPMEIAGVLSFLSGPDGGVVTGSALVLDRV